MKEQLEQIRNLIGEGEAEAALDALDHLFAASGNGDLRDRVTVLKGRFSKLERDRRLGLRFDASEQNEIVMAALDLLKLAERPPKAPPPNFDPPIVGPVQPPVEPPRSPNLKEQGYIGRLWVDGDPFEYYLNTAGQIARLDPATRAPFPVAARYPSNDPRFAWAYFVFSMNWWCSVDHQGIIWTINPYGMVVRVGQFQPF